MLNCEPKYSTKHTNKFIVLHGVPYLVGEYVDRTKFEQIDDSAIADGIIIDQCDPLRSIIDIQLSDIERRNSDGRLSTIGNSTRLSNMIDIIKHEWNRTEGRLRVLRNGLVIRVYYQIENARTGIVLRSMNESFRIEDPNYFVYVNPNDISDNSLIVNFSESKITSVCQFTYRRDPMVLRITDIQMFYEVTELDPMKPRVERYDSRDPGRYTPYYGPDPDAYYYHQRMQNIHHFEKYNWRNDRCQVPPETWSSFNRFYHYDEEEQNFMIHFDQVYDRRCKVIQLACGKIKLNRTFIVNPGTRLVFKFCIWKNDAIITNDCAAIADALKIPNSGDYITPVSPTDGSGATLPSYNPYAVLPAVSYENYPVPPSSTAVDYAQNRVINQLIDIVTNLESKVAQLCSQEQSSPSSPSGDDGGNNTTSDPKEPSEEVGDDEPVDPTGDPTGEPTGTDSSDPTNSG